MIDTSIKGELQNCIRNAQDCMVEMGKMLDQLPDREHAEKSRMMELCKKTGLLLKEAEQRCETLF